jgi:hypothetical protein
METKNTDSAAPAALPVIRDPRIWLGMPVYGKIDVPFVQCLMALMGTSTIVQVPDFLIGDSLVNRARNNIAGRFLAGIPGQDGAGNPVLVKHDWLLFLDTDLVFRVEDVEKLYQYALKKGVGIYAGTYPIKQLKPKVVFNNMPGCAPDEEGIVEVREAGTGFMLIHRNVFEQMIEKFKDEITFCVDTGDVTKPDVTSYDFFSVGVYFDPLLKRKRFLSEDWYFCQRWRALGGKVLMHSKVSCNHIGVYSYPGNPQEVMEAGDHYRKAFELMEKARKPQVVKVGPPDHYKKEPELVAAVD